MKRVAIIVAALVLLFGFSKGIQEAILCRSILRNALFNNFQQYRLDHAGHYPPDIISFAAAFPGGDRVETNRDILIGRLTCPGAGAKSSAIAKGEIESDFIYVNWEPFFGADDLPIGCPLFYDRRLSNHYGLGVNVLTTDRRFFDFRARWLRKFTADHPEYGLRLPDD